MDYTQRGNGSTGRASPGDLLTEYDAADIKMVRLDPRTKKGIDGEWQKRSLPLEEHVEHVEQGGNVGLQMGEVSGWVCAVDPDCPEAEQLAPRFLPGDTLRQAKGGGRPSQYFYRSPGLGFRQFRDLDNEIIMDLKASNNGKGHMVVVEPSVHPTKGAYRFVGGFDAARIREVPKDELRAAVSRLAVATLIARHLPERGRHDLALALAGYMLRNNGGKSAEVIKILRAAWEVKGAPDEGLRDLERIVSDTTRKLKDGEPVKGGRTLEEMRPGMPSKIAKFLGWEKAGVDERRRSFPPTDMGNAERLVDRHGRDLRYVHGWGRYLIYDGARWRVDDTGAVRRRAKDTVRHIYPEAKDAADEAGRRAIAQHAMRSESRNRIDAMIDLAKDDLPVTPVELDADPWLLNVENGTIDLRSGELREHDRLDLLTKIAPVVYDPNAEAPVFEAFLERVLPSKSLREFVRRAVGYSLTGDVSEQVLFFQHGSGANGKTTLMNAILGVCGDYGKQAAPDLLVAKGTTHPTELADLFGARCVASTEVEDGRRLAENLTKQLTGGDRIKARYMRQDFWEFDPTHKIWLSANHKPEVRGTDHAIWRRIRLIPFTETIPKGEQDPRLPEKLRAETPGILAWAVRGCIEWRREGLGEPEEVSKATSQYREEQDVMASFIEECCVVRPGAWVKFKHLYAAYKEWCEESGERDVNKRRFGDRLTERGYESGRGTDNVAIRRGIALAHEAEN